MAMQENDNLNPWRVDVKSILALPTIPEGDQQVLRIAARHKLKDCQLWQETVVQIGQNNPVSWQNGLRRVYIKQALSSITVEMADPIHPHLRTYHTYRYDLDQPKVLLRFRLQEIRELD